MEGTMECSVCYTKDNLKSICATSPLHKVCGQCFNMMKTTPNCFGIVDLKCPECRGDIQEVREQRTRRCGICGEIGHDRRKCSQRDPVAEAERLKKLKEQRERSRARQREQTNPYLTPTGRVRVVRGSMADMARRAERQAYMARRAERQAERQAEADATMARMARADAIVARHTGTFSSRVSAIRLESQAGSHWARTHMPDIRMMCIRRICNLRDNPDGRLLSNAEEELLNNYVVEILGRDWDEVPIYEQQLFERIIEGTD